MGPQAYGLFSEAPRPQCQRQLVLISKVLQNLANGVEFGKKEEFMQVMNDFIRTNAESNRQLLSGLCEIRSSVLTVRANALPGKVVDNALTVLANHLVNVLPKVMTNLDTALADEPDQVDQRKAALGAIMSRIE